MSLVKVKGNGNANSFPKLFSDFFNKDLFEFPGWELNGGLSVFADVPSVNITEDNKEYKIEMAAPGLEKKDFKVEVENNLLTISAKKEKEEKEEKKNFCRKEFSYESFSRSFQLPENLVADKIDATYDGGILKLTLPKKEVTLNQSKKKIKVA